MTESFFNEYLRTSNKFENRGGLFYQRGLLQNGEFERAYTSLRSAEGRLYANDVVAELPRVARDHPLAKEWAIRKDSLDRLIKYLHTRNSERILEVGCGNGWLVNNVQSRLGVDCCGIDINELELKQAVTVFGHQSLSFAYGDINQRIFEEDTVDIVILAGAIQYFSNPVFLLENLLRLLRKAGEIHVIDSPIYTSHSVEAARERSKDYFTSAGKQPMVPHYFHHTWDIFLPFKYSILHQPANFWNTAMRKLWTRSPFPWVAIRK